MMGLALGDAVGAHVEFRPHQYLVDNPVTDITGGGTWGLEKGKVMYMMKKQLLRDCRAAASSMCYLVH